MNLAVGALIALYGFASGCEPYKPRQVLALGVLSFACGMLFVWA